MLPFCVSRVKLLEVKWAPYVSKRWPITGGRPAEVVEIPLKTRGCGMQPSDARVSARRRNELERVTCVTIGHVIRLPPAVCLVQVWRGHDIHVSSFCSTHGRVSEVHVILLDIRHAEVWIAIWVMGTPRDGLQTIVNLDMIILWQLRKILFVQLKTYRFDMIGSS